MTTSLTNTVINKVISFENIVGKSGTFDLQSLKIIMNKVRKVLSLGS